ncbi:hypothetical protein [Sorangium sp. So ce426]|uniref:hypothetical protein n=1 Tax=Sorangium sp. So ce426 TaxID=3133312 RepID=UPI003F5B1743
MLHPVASPSIEVLWAERPFVALLLRALHVPARDRDDLLQTVLLGAWKAIRARRYRPDPLRHPRHALRAWLHGVVWHQVSHYRDRAHVRCEILLGAPLAPAGQAHVEMKERSSPAPRSARSPRCPGAIAISSSRRPGASASWPGHESAA